MGQILAMGLTYCCTSAAGSLCQSCFGSTAAGTTGRKRSVILLGMTVAIALWFQYSVGPSIVNRSGWMWKTYSAIPGMGKMMYKAWHDPCAELYGSDDVPISILEKCAGNAGVYRPTSIATLFFVFAAISAATVPSLNREAWPAKYTIFLFLVLFTMFISNGPLFSGIYVWLARLGAFVFVILQQVILIDVAYNWNDDWVERANSADRLAYGTGSTWLQAIVGTCVGMYSATIIAIVLLYQHFTGSECTDNAWIISLTLLAVIAMTAIQLSGTEGSLLTSSVLSLYSAYLAFSIVSKNPNPTCNPRLGHEDFWGIFVGLFLTVVSLIWTGFSYSAEGRLSVESVQSAKAVGPGATTDPMNSNIAPAGQDVNLDVPFLSDDERPMSGLVTQGDGESPENIPVSGNVWKLNVVMALISCYVAMILTGWGTVDGMYSDGPNAANPTIGRVNMAIIGISQWLAIGLYTWTLVAPRLFPDRDFS